MSKKEKLSGVVYSSEHGKMCPQCGLGITSCRCRQNEVIPESDGIVRVCRERSGRKGKEMTLITGIPLKASGLIQFSKTLKKKCGTGGTVKNGVIEIQGDHRDLLLSLLKKEGWTVKLSGG